MKRSLPRTPEGWLLEIRLAIRDAREAKPVHPEIPCAELTPTQVVVH
jgi:hypothetical protein